MIDPISIRALIAIADHGSVAEAARVLGYTPPNISQHVRKLESHFGTPLVERVGRGVVLTPAALTLVGRGRPLVDGLEQLRRAPLHDDEVKGVIRVGAFPTAVCGLLIPTITRAATSFPGLRIEPYEMEADAALQALARGTLDAVIHKSWGASIPDEYEPRSLHRTELGIDTLDALVPATHVLANRGRVFLRELASDQWAISPRHDPYGRWIASHDPSLLTPLGHAFQAAEFQTLTRYVEAGLAVTVMPRLGRGTLSASVRAVPLADPDAYRKIHLYVRPITARSQVAEAVTAMFKDALQNEEHRDRDPIDRAEDEQDAEEHPAGRRSGLEA
ncbi:LysR family transcriptional regulator [Microbacterium sp. cx-59]|uniref:LysR family transcriptional regulator n=1 Tax=Microbacterium sp. cx-59 TaxID=2891207 RepID=UPI001E54EA6B|nr:LysR family transcriptional regulator [Microbacterium sp. cx-59]MCC4907714.1 LysR family transcriptional regulator [Microbacterium sp. cx-59]